MPHTFFKSWQLWEKMTFVLACAIVLTCVVGGLRLLYIRWKLQKYNKRLKDDESRLKTEADAPVLPVSSILPLPRDKAPFGIRAIESGIEIDGIWISRPNSPVPSSQESPRVPLLRQHPSGSGDQLPFGRTQSFPSRTQIGRVTPNLSSHSLSREHPSTPNSLLSLSQGPVSTAGAVHTGGSCSPKSFGIGPADSPTYNPDNDENNLENMFERRRLTHSASSGQLTGRSRPPSDDSKSTTTTS